MIILSNKFLDKFFFLDAVGMAHLGCIVIMKTGLSKSSFNRVMEHEIIHLKQQRRWLIIFWYVGYILNFLWNLVMCWNVKQAYRYIYWERQARGEI